MAKSDDTGLVQQVEAAVAALQENDKRRGVHQMCRAMVAMATEIALLRDEVERLSLDNEYPSVQRHSLIA